MYYIIIGEIMYMTCYTLIDFYMHDSLYPGFFFLWRYNNVTSKYRISI